MVNEQSHEHLDRMALAVDDSTRQQLVECLVTQFAEAAFRWALTVLGDEEAAYDAVQDAWLNAYLHLDQLRESAAFPAWFRKIVLTACFHARRHDRTTNPLPDESDPEAATPQTDPTSEIEQQERREHIRKAIRALPEAERLVTELFYFAEIPQAEIAEVLAVPVTTVKKRLQYARRHLKGLIRPEFVSWLDLYGFSTNDEVSALSLPTAAAIEWMPVGARLISPLDWLNERETKCCLTLD